MKYTPLSLAIACALPYAIAHAEESSNTNTATGTEVIEVTGSRIKRTDIEGIEVVVTLSADDIMAQGHANVFDALQALTMNTGIFIGEENTNNFNANAQALNLRGFGAGYTLTLLNGRRIPVLPKPSGSVAGNVVNLAMIPSDAVARVEILSGGASAIYGSDAVAGVVNIILKKDLDETVFNLRAGDTKDGGGASQKLSLSSGGNVAGLRYSAGLEWDTRKPIYGDDRDWFDDPTDSPDESRHQLSQVMSYWARYEPKPWMLIDLKDRCNSVGYQAVQPPRDFYSPDPYYCGDNVYGTYTVRNARDRLSGFANLEYEFGEHKWFATLVGSQSDADAGLYRYSFGIDYDVVSDVNDPDTWQASRHVWRSFRDFEVPTSNQTFDENNLVLITGLQGSLAGEYDYSVSATASRYHYQDQVVRFDDQAMLALLFGEKGVTWDQPWAGSRWAVVQADSLNSDFTPKAFDFFGQLSPDMFASAAHNSVGDGKSYLYALSADLAGELTQLTAGPVQFALVAEVFREGYQFITDAATVNGDIYGWSGIVGQGDRNHYALGGELAIPLLAANSAIGSVELKLASRYDYYADDSDVGGASTYQLGLSWRPYDGLLVRGNYATSFRAPDMHYLFAERSSSYTSGTDYYSCASKEGLQSGESWAACNEKYATGSIRQYSEGDLSLQEETGHSSNIGVVAALSENWSVTVDLYQLQLENQVGLIGADTVLRYEAECRLGFSQSGETIDGNSAKCQEMLARVSRGGPKDTVQNTITSPFNTGLRKQTGIDVSSEFKHSLATFGNLFAKLNYTHILSTKEQYLPEDELQDIRDLQWNDEFRTRTDVTLGWFNDQFSVSAFINRLGSSPVRWSDDVHERFGAWTRVNLNLQYHVTANLSVNSSIVNLFDKQPPLHQSEKWWPFADVSKYSPVGTEYFVGVKFRF